MRSNYKSIVHLDDEWLPSPPLIGKEQDHPSNTLDSDTSTNSSSSCTEIGSENQALLPPTNTTSWRRNESLYPKDIPTRQSRKQQVVTTFLSTMDHDHDDEYYQISSTTDTILEPLSTPQRNSMAADLRLTMISNFSTAYNVNSISLALKLMEDYHKNHLHHPEFEISATHKALCSSSLMAGMILGQLVGGMLGDVLGRHLAMTCVMLLQVLAALASSLSQDFTWPPPNHPHPSSSSSVSVVLSELDMLMIWRFVLGIGAGGVYPLAATLTSECQNNRTMTRAAQRVALTFSMQGWGYLTVPVVSWILITVLPPSLSPWRILLALGALPGMWLALCRCPRRSSNNRVSSWSTTLTKEECHHSSHKSAESSKLRLSSSPGAMSVWDAIRLEPNLGSKLLGTGGCWFLFDVLFYGNTLFQPMVLSSAFGNSETVLKLARDTSIIAGLALPGYIVSVIAIGKYHQSPRYIQLQGFLAMAILYTIIGRWFYQLANYPMLLIILYSLSFFWSNYGPNSTVSYF
jgi:MFS transporter, PHS family, inorganic phosphate transporter